MVTKEKFEEAILKYDKNINPAINPIKIWEYKFYIKPKLDKIPRINVIYPKNLFGNTKEPTEIIILTNDNKLMKGVIKKQSNIVSFYINEIEPKEVDIDNEKDVNGWDKFLGLDFSTNASIIKRFLLKVQ